MGMITYTKLRKDIENNNKKEIIDILKTTRSFDIQLLLKLLCKENNFEFFEFLLDNSKLDNKDYLKLLNFVITRFDFIFFEKIFKLSIVEQNDLDGYVLNAATLHRTDFIIFLLDNGADINKNCILNYFIDTKYINFFKYLISRGANPNLKEMYSPINYIVRYENIVLLKYIIEELKIDITHTENSPLKYTCNFDIIEYLVIHGADINVLNEKVKNIIINKIRTKKLSKILMI